MLQPHVYGFNNMGGEGCRYGPSGFYWSEILVRPLMPLVLI
jgi:hypothetical protein